MVGRETGSATQSLQDPNESRTVDVPAVVASGSAVAVRRELTSSTDNGCGW
jgi:hypothetical protein